MLAQKVGATSHNTAGTRTMCRPGMGSVQQVGSRKCGAPDGIWSAPVPAKNRLHWNSISGTEAGSSLAMACRRVHTMLPPSLRDS